MPGWSTTATLAVREVKGFGDIRPSLDHRHSALDGADGMARATAAPASAGVGGKRAIAIGERRIDGATCLC